MRFVPVFLLFFAPLLLSNCNRLDGLSFVPAINGYSDANKKLTFLKRPLREISGIDFISKDRLVAIQDEKGKIFFVDPFAGTQVSFDFGKNGDYEDVVRAGPYYYVLESNGHLFQISIADHKLLNIYKYDFGKDVEFETIYFEPESNQLVLICKQCGRDSESINAYRFDLAKFEYNLDYYFSIDISDIRRMGKSNRLECKPSAAAINPVTNKLFIIASVGKLLLECSRTGKLEAVHRLNPDHFQQPEGITFSPLGDLFIANEGVQGKATLLKYTYSK